MKRSAVMQVKNECRPSLAALAFQMLSPPSESVVPPLLSKVLNGLSRVCVRGKAHAG